MTKYSVLIGINYINTKDELNGCINDVFNMKNFLEFRLGYKNFIVLTDNTQIKPTRNNILSAINSLVSKLKPGDDAWVHYSGHGLLVDDFNGDEKYDTCICPIDYNISRRRGGGLISDDTIRSVLINKIPKGTKLYFVLDACHSATGLDLAYKYDDSSFLKDKSKKPVEYIRDEWVLDQKEHYFKQYPITNGDICCVSGCQDNQESADDFIKSDQMFGGVLTSTMLSLFKTNDLNNYKWTDFLKDLNCTIKVNGYDQVPALTSGKPLELDNTILTNDVENAIKQPIRPSNYVRKNIFTEAKFIHAKRIFKNKTKFMKMTFK